MLEPGPMISISHWGMFGPSQAPIAPPLTWIVEIYRLRREIEKVLSLSATRIVL